MSTREQVEAEAEDCASRHYADLHSHRAGAERGFIAGRTVSNEQQKDVERAIHRELKRLVGRIDWAEDDTAIGAHASRISDAAFRAAGFLIEGYE